MKLFLKNQFSKSKKNNIWNSRTSAISIKTFYSSFLLLLKFLQTRRKKNKPFLKRFKRSFGPSSFYYLSFLIRQFVLNKQSFILVFLKVSKNHLLACLGHCAFNIYFFCPSHRDWNRQRLFYVLIHCKLTREENLKFNWHYCYDFMTPLLL